MERRRMEKKVLVTLTDRNYINPVKQMFSSVYHNSGWDGDYLLFAHKVPKKELTWFKKKGIQVKEVKPLHDKDFDHFPATILSKLYLFKEEFKKWDRVVFLDGDITVEASLNGMCKQKGFSAVGDVGYIPVSKQFYKPKLFGEDPKRKKKFERLYADYDHDSTSFNVGVFTFTTDVIKNDSFEVLLDLFKEYGLMTPYNEQAIMNLYFNNNWNQLPIVYNNYYIYIRKAFTFESKMSDGIVNHFIFKKPWKHPDPNYLPRYERNLELAEKIDLENRLPPAKVWSKRKIQKKCNEIEQIMVYPNVFNTLWNRPWEHYERFLGQIGIRMRKVSPGMYKAIKGTGWFGD